MKIATLCYLRNQGKTLMLHRVTRENDFHHGKWNGLGGKIQPGESPEECARREVLEESGLNAVQLRLHGVITFPMFDGIDDWYVFVFSCDDFSGELSQSDEGKLEWIEDAKLLELNLWPGDREFMPWLKQDNFFSAKFSYRNKELVSHEVVFYPNGS